MQVIWAKQALVGSDWMRDVRLEVREGRIADIQAGVPADGDHVELLLPAPANCHSHAFQRAMAGLTERRGPSGKDSFWTWRVLMYRFLEQLTPEQVQAITAYVQMEMLEAGFGASVEFHYLHHGHDGTPYIHLGEMSERIAAAADQSGIGLTLLPVHYQYGGCDGRPLDPGQNRFGNDPERFSRLMEDAAASIAALPHDSTLGAALHSLRAVKPADIALIASMAPDGPVHMHLAEQVAEVEEIETAYGVRPVEWALDNIPLDRRWCLIHCTQMTPQETTRLAATRAVAGLCPLTEASLGDGIFDGVRWTEAGGAFAIGSDSNIRISLAEELRQLDTSQRLRDHTRAALATKSRSTGRRLLEDASAGGARAANRGNGRIELDGWADLLSLDQTHPDLEGLDGDTALDTFIFAGGREFVDAVWSGGRKLVSEGRHLRRDEISAAYRTAVLGLRREL
ncbi:formimidoylglutamate deiminase [Pseudoruegeria sp. HB172150]|uniref:formimidoylglutamate deiminase n=1 Tax=Pseudoruegeria sp. HB172150 TaxID=2721164 RepID=UPI001557A429|nr:formimidoylglutamate deiminase [Pseudoruegeria sp. HB172150]